MNFHKYLKNSKKSTSNYIQAIKILNNRQQGCFFHLFARLYTATVQIALTFGQPFFNSTPESAFDSLKQTERRVIRLAFHLPLWTANAELYDHYAIPTLQDHLNNFNAKSKICLTKYTVLLSFLNGDHLTLYTFKM